MSDLCHGLYDVGVAGLHSLEHLTELPQGGLGGRAGLKSADVAKALGVPVLIDGFKI